MQLLLLCASIGLCVLPTPAQATEAGEVVSRLINQGSYYDFLVNHLYTHVGDDRGMRGNEHDLCRDEIAAVFSSYGLDVELQEFQMSGLESYNIIATQHGTVDPSVQYIVGAHYDSENNPGADDDASGVAGLLELARVLSQFETAYTIKYIAFDREEDGLHGSWYYVQNLTSDDIRGMIQLDMIAFDPNDLFRIKLKSLEASAPLQTALVNAFAEYSPLIYAIPSPGVCNSDHCPFEEAGFQGCEVIEDAQYENPCYHQECDSVDTPGYIKYEYATEIVRGVAGFLADHAIATVPFDCTTGCAVSPNCSVDCDANGLCDWCELACLDAGDCDGNGLLDSCDLANSNLDCNGNSVLDVCDIAAGFSSDCNLNLVPDACEVAADPSIDCNSNGIPDECDIKSGTSADCDDNGEIDDCEIADDPSLDCDGNGLLDWCEMASRISGYIGTWGGAGGLRYWPPLLARSDVTLRFSTRGNLRHDVTWAALELDYTEIGKIFETPWEDCDEYKTVEFVVPAELFNECAADGSIYIATPVYQLNNDYEGCGSPVYISAEIDYIGVLLEGDCNMDGLLDACQDDCDENGTPDALEFCDTPSLDCNDNDLLDSCEVIEGTAPDCNANGIPDSCDITSGFSTDCDGNGLPDTCEIIADPTLDCDGGGTLDLCDMWQPYQHTQTSPLSYVVIGESSPYYIASAPLALSDVAFRVSIRGSDLRHEGVWAEVQINGVPIGNLFETSWSDCWEDRTEELIIPMDIFNAAEDAYAIIEVYYRCDSCDFTPCPGNHRVQMQTFYMVANQDADCDEDTVPDVCQIAADPTLDCDGNGVLDSCEVTRLQHGNAGSNSVVFGSSNTFWISAAGAPCVSDVTLRFTTVGDLRHDGNWIEIQMDGVVIGTLFQSTWESCTNEISERLIIPMDLFNASISSYSNYVTVFYKSDSPDYTPCTSGNYLRAVYEYAAADQQHDCNANGIPDFCDLADGTTEDCNNDEVPDVCQTLSCPPQPDPMVFEPGEKPHAISTSEIAMTATEATHVRGVQYEFRHSLDTPYSTVTTDRYFVHTRLRANSRHTYAVRAKDLATGQNVTQYSYEYSAVTFIQTPTGVEMNDVTDSSASIKALGLFYNYTLGNSAFYFELYPPDGSGANAWMTTNSQPVINVSDLMPGTSYKVRAKARNQMAQETEYTEWVRFRTAGDNPCNVCGDLDGDDDVDLVDYEAFIDAFRSTSDDARFNLCADMDGDDRITARDFAQFVQCYREANPNAAPPRLPAKPKLGPPSVNPGQLLPRQQAKMTR